MVSMALATLDLVAHDDARPALAAVYLEGHAVLSCGELAGPVGESGRVLRLDSKALVLCAGDRDLATLLAYLAALRLGHADRLSGLYSGAEPHGAGDGRRLRWRGPGGTPRRSLSARWLCSGAAVVCEMTGSMTCGSWPRSAPGCWNHRTPAPSSGGTSRPGNRPPGRRVARADRLTSDEHRH
jgi:hypothetical protein